MVATPTGNVKKSKFSKIRRRIIDTESEDNENDNATKQPSTTKRQPKKTRRREVSTDNIAQLSGTSVNRQNVGGDSFMKEVLYKSVCSPMVSRSRRRSTLQKSLYKTPVIRSSIRAPYVISKEARIPQSLKNKWREDVEKILSKAWKISYMSSVFRFNISSKNLKAAYERTLKTRIMNVYPSYHLVVKMQPSSFFNQNPKATDAVFLKVSSLMPTEDEEDRMVTVYEAVLLRTQGRTQSAANEGVEWFPLLLYSGLVAIHNTFITWIQSSFGCYVTPRCLPMTAVLWVAGVWSYGKCQNKRHEKPENREIVLQYHIQIPPRMVDVVGKGKYSITFRCTQLNLINLWTKIKGKEEQELNVEDLSKFHCALESYVESLTNIPKSLLSLSNVSTACISLSVMGKVKMNCSKTFLSMLRHLIEIFEYTCHFKDFDEEVTEFEDDSDEE